MTTTNDRRAIPLRRSKSSSPSTMWPLSEALCWKKRYALESRSEKTYASRRSDFATSCLTSASRPTSLARNCVYLSRALTAIAMLPRRAGWHARRPHRALLPRRRPCLLHHPSDPRCRPSPTHQPLHPLLSQTHLQTLAQRCFLHPSAIHLLQTIPQLLAPQSMSIASSPLVTHEAHLLPQRKPPQASDGPLCNLVPVLALRAYQGPAHFIKLRA